MYTWTSEAVTDIRKYWSILSGGYLLYHRKSCCGDCKSYECLLWFIRTVERPVRFCTQHWKQLQKLNFEFSVYYVKISCGLFEWHEDYIVLERSCSREYSEIPHFYFSLISTSFKIRGTIPSMPSSRVYCHTGCIYMWCYIIMAMCYGDVTLAGTNHDAAVKSL